MSDEASLSCFNFLSFWFEFDLNKTKTRNCFNFLKVIYIHCAKLITCMNSLNKTVKIVCLVYAIHN